MFSVCGFSDNQGNRLGQVTYDRFFSISEGFEMPELGAVIAPYEGIYLVNFYTHIDSGTSTPQTVKDTQDYYSAYIRINGKELKYEGHLKSSLVGSHTAADDVTTGRNLILHLNKGDEVDVNLNRVMFNGAGLAHASFCVAEIERSKQDGVYACGFKSSHRNRRGPIGYDRHLSNSDDFGSQGSLNLGQGTFRAPVEGIYLVNFESHFDCGKGPTNKETAYRVVIRKNGKSIGPEGNIITSIQGSDDVHDDITTGKSISLHLKPNDRIDMFVEDIIPTGGGLAHTTFCVSLIQKINNGSPVLSFCGVKTQPVKIPGILSYERLFTHVDQFYYGGLNARDGVFKAPKTGSYLVSFDTHIDSGSKQEYLKGYYSAYIRKNGQRLQYEGHIKSSVVGTDTLHTVTITGRSLVLYLLGSDEVDIELNNVMNSGKGLFNYTFCVTLLEAFTEPEEE